MGLIMTIARHDLKMVLRDRAAVMWMVVLPIVFITFFGLVMGGGEQGRPVDAKVRLTVVDYDGEFLARSLIEALGSERLELVEMTPVEAETAEDMVRTLVIPVGFTESVLAGRQATLRLEKHPETSEEAALVAQAKIIASASRVVGRLVALAGDEAAVIDESSFAAERPGSDLVSVESRFAGRARTAPSGFAQSIPGNTVLFVMLVALTYGAASVTGERNGGQLRRLATTPASRGQIVLGKLVGRLMVSFVQITLLVLAAVAAKQTLGIAIGDHTAAAYAVLLVYALCVAPLGVAMGAWFRDPDRAANVGVLLTMVMGALGGTMWPLEFVSPTMQKVALLFPTGWAMKALHQVISFGRNLGDVVPEMAVLLAFSAVFTVIATRSLRIE
jgi:ABC-type multidrug transport system permease subunit